jgi:hypothetical protein
VGWGTVSDWHNTAGAALWFCSVAVLCCGVVL